MRVSTFILLSLFMLSQCVYGQSERSYWVDRYLSVSYPLKTIKVTSPYGIRKDPFSGERVHHSGLDLEARYTEVYSMFDGIVESVGTDARSGHYVILRHGVYTVSYCHLSRVTVIEGDGVLAGDPVGITGNSGRSTGPHLHISCRYNGELRDPNTLLLYINDVRMEALAALGGKVTSLRALTLSERKDFYERYAAAAMAQQQRYGIPASVTLAQMAYESSYGRSPLALSGNNFFGIKCNKEWLAAGKPYSLHDDDRKNEKFCNYATVDESIEHHSHLLMSDRYRRCHRFKATDYHGWLVGIKAAGYATAPDYVKKLEGMIRHYKLYLYDHLAMQA